MTEVVRFKKKATGAVVEPRPAPPVSEELNRAAYELRVRQQQILSELGILALKGTPFPELLEHTARLTAEGLRADFAKVLEYLPDQNRLLVRAGVGWGPGVVGSATIGADLESPGGYALRTGVPVISNHLENEERFRTPELLLEYGIYRAMNVILQGEGAPFGVLEVDSRSEGEFSEQDITFLQGAANLLGMAIERQRMERDLRGALDRQQMLMREVNHRVNNSLQIVGSMLHLQGRRTDNKEIQHQLQQASSRVTAIARAHNRLYRTDEFTTLDLGAYLSDLCADFCERFQVENGNGVRSPIADVSAPEFGSDCDSVYAVQIGDLAGDFSGLGVHHSYFVGVRHVNASTIGNQIIPATVAADSDFLAAVKQLANDDGLVRCLAGDTVSGVKINPIKKISLRVLS